MPKLKSNRAARKRFKILKSGRVKRKRSFHRHILTSKSQGRKRSLRAPAMVADVDVPSIKRLLPYG